MAGPARYRITNNEGEAYVLVPAEAVIEAFRAVVGPTPVAYLENEGLHYSFGDWSCTVSGSPFELVLAYDGRVSRHHLERLTESLVRELEAAQHEHLDWSRTDSLSCRQVDAASGEITSPPLGPDHAG
jgi:hypothetical protein